MEGVVTNQEALEASDVIAKIFLIKGKIEGTPVNEWDMNTLVDYVFTLCKIMPNLSDLKDYAYIMAEALSEQYKSEVRDAYIELKNGGDKMTDTMAKSLAEQRCDKTKQLELEADHKARWLRSLHQDLDRLISFTQTKSKTMVDDRIRNNIPNN